MDWKSTVSIPPVSAVICALLCVIVGIAIGVTLSGRNQGRYQIVTFAGVPMKYDLWTDEAEVIMPKKIRPIRSQSKPASANVPASTSLPTYEEVTKYGKEVATPTPSFDLDQFLGNYDATHPTPTPDAP